VNYLQKLLNTYERNSHTRSIVRLDPNWSNITKGKTEKTRLETKKVLDKTDRMTERHLYTDFDIDFEKAQIRT